MGSTSTGHIGGTGTRIKRQLDFELNIIPILDCLTILVTFMLAAGVYYSIAMLDVKVAGGQSTQVNNSSQDVQITVEVQPSLDLLVKISGKENKSFSYKASDGRPDTEDLQKALGEIKSKYSAVDTVTLTANREVAYQNVIQILEAIRRSHQDVLLGGF